MSSEGRSNECLSNGTIDALGRRRFERVTLGIEHVYNNGSARVSKRGHACTHICRARYVQDRQTSSTYQTRRASRFENVTAPRRKSTYRYLSTSPNQKLAMSLFLVEATSLTSLIPAYATVAGRYFLKLWIALAALSRYLVLPVARHA